jgi:hypothetical protein
VERVEGHAAAWLAQDREGLNRRFEKARRHHPALDPATTLAWLARVLPPMAGPEPGAGPLCSSVVDLVLLHTGRDAFATHPGLVTLLTHTLPLLRPLLLRRPEELPAALSNAVENLGQAGEALARGLAALGPHVNEPSELLAAGALLAWRLGEARLRRNVLEAAGRLPPRAVLAALDLADWPEAGAQAALAALCANSWMHPRRAISRTTVAALATNPGLARELVARLASPPPGVSVPWSVVTRIGGFAGFEGQFEAPPVVLDLGDRHTFFAASGGRFFCLRADVFGWTSREVPTPVLRVKSAAQPRWRRLPPELEVTASDELSPDGVLRAGSEKAAVPGLERALAFTVRDGVVAACFPDSYRIRIAVPVRSPL